MTITIEPQNPQKPSQTLKNPQNPQTLGKVQFSAEKYFPLSDQTKISVFLRNRGC